MALSLCTAESSWPKASSNAMKSKDWLATMRRASDRKLAGSPKAQQIPCTWTSKSCFCSERLGQGSAEAQVQDNMTGMVIGHCLFPPPAGECPMMPCHPFASYQGFCCSTLQSVVEAFRLLVESNSCQSICSLLAAWGDNLLGSFIKKPQLESK